MGTVSLLASVFGLLGCIVLALVFLFITGGGLISAQALRSPQGAVIVVGALAPFLLLSLGPFLAWGILRSLCEIHAQGERSIATLQGLVAKTTNNPVGLGVTRP